MQNLELTDLVSIEKATKSLNLDVDELLLQALSGKVTLFVVSNKKYREVLIPCKMGVLHHTDPGNIIEQYVPLIDQVAYVDVELGQIIELQPSQIKQLLLNQAFSEVELYKTFLDIDDDTDGLLWKSEREIYNWEDEELGYPLPSYPDIELESVKVSKTYIKQYKTQPSESKSSGDVSSRTALKVVGLLMHHLAKSPKYASGNTPNKSQIKALLLDLAAEFDVNEYGLSKVDERLLKEAMDYLEDQKN